jgi:hypothetical protein
VLFLAVEYRMPCLEGRESNDMLLSLILLVVLILAVAPAWPYSRRWDIIPAEDWELSW